MSVSRLVLASFFVVSFSQLASAGISTNGTAISLEENNAWFLGPKPIEYCIEKADTFRGETSDISKSVRQSFAQWRAFFQKYRLNQAQFQNLSRFRNLGLSLEFKEVSHCDRPKEQLRFLFGIENGDIFSALEKDEGALALTIRGIYNHDTYRNGGIIYFRNGEADKLKMHHMILHELGHIFGMSHDSVGVMSSKLAYDVISKQTAPAWFGQIETPLWPYRVSLGEAYQLTAQKPAGFPNSELGSLNRKLKFSPQGKFHMTLVWNKLSAGAYENTLSFQSVETGKSEKFIGKFKEEFKSPMENWGPKVHLLLQCGECVDADCSAFCGSRAYGLPRYLDANPNPKIFNGYFISGASRLPTTIVMKRDIVIRIFDNESLSWWAFGN